MDILQIQSMSNYQRYLRNNPEEAKLLFKAIIIGVTNFFRDPEAFELLKKKYIPELIEKVPKGSTLRAWVPGCSTGEEAYSLAIIFLECLQKAKFRGNYKIQIFATDIDLEMVEKARRGIFPAGIASEVSPKRLENYFTKVEDGYQIKKEVRDTVLFAVQNVIMDPPFTKLHFISCRNLLIYFESELQKSLLPVFYQSFNPSGLLYLGSSETVSGFDDLFTTLDKKWKIYEKKEGAILPDKIRDLTGMVFVPKTVPEFRTAPRELERSFPELIRSILFEDFAPPAVLVNKRGDIVYVSGRTGKYLEPAAGKANLNVLAMAREDLRFEIGSAMSLAASRKEPVTVKNIKVKVNGGEQYINLTVKPVQAGDQSELLLIIFQDIEPPGTALKGKSRKDDSYSPDLQRELHRAKERLNSTMEEMQITQEEYRTANEELQSTNEELQSTNEELISSKEEMQSLNEELMSLNAELQDKVSSLTQAEDDMKNLLNSTDIATIFLDDSLKLRSFTPTASKIIKLIKGDVGRPITDIASSLRYERLAEDADHVLEKLVPKEIEVESKDGSWYQMRILPYRTVNNVIQGVVITFTDITELKKLEMNLLKQRKYAEEIVETVREPLVVLDSKFRVVSANRSFYTLFHIKREETEKKSLFSLGKHQWDIPELRELMEKVLPESKTIEGFRVEHVFPGLGKRTMLLNARRVGTVADGEQLILLAIEDVTKNGRHQAR
jgi:two-component system CheB/CheR fusion protein